MTNILEVNYIRIDGGITASPQREPLKPLLFNIANAYTVKALHEQGTKCTSYMYVLWGDNCSKSKERAFDKQNEYVPPQDLQKTLPLWALWQSL
jgi:hypothetical protein